MKQIILLLFSLLLFLINVSANDSIRFANDSLHLHFKGVICESGKDTLYQGTVIDSLFIIKDGVFSKDFRYQRYVSYYLDGIIWGKYNNPSEHKIYLLDDYYLKTDEYRNNKLRHIYDDDEAAALSFYNPSDRSWFYGKKHNDKSSGIYKKNGRYIPADDSGDEFLCKYIIYGGLFWFFVFWVLYVITKPIRKEPNILFLIIISLLLVIILFYIIQEDVLYYQFLLPLVIFFIVCFSQEFKLNKYTASVCIISLLLSLYENFAVKDTIFIEGQSVSICWKPGTGIIKRFIIRSELKNLHSTEITNRNGIKSILLAGPSPIKDVTYSAVMGKTFWWITCLFPDQLKNQLTQIECRVFLERLQDITSLRDFDLIRVEEIEQIINEPWFNYSKESNERTSTLYKDSIPLNSEKYIYTYDDVAYLDSTDFLLLTKGICYCSKAPSYLPIYDSTFRLVLRKNEANSRYFTVQGIKLPVSKEIILPDTIILKKIDGRAIENKYYDKFQEQFVESYYDDRTIEYITPTSKVTKDLFQKAKQTDYVFKPIFEYK